MSARSRTHAYGDLPPRRQVPFTLVSRVLPLHDRQTKNLLVSYSPKKLDFF
ncbi:hypothetical protein [Streptomyces sp. NBC_00893]|uniref:hypothetical protein n=1 Tax=Streptomyces sp. NBC_00893 TaxID=2975862 RepID=UPI00225A0B2F|nr:hypothetical protein [Streptomyces sp. NBC_00893]MCX4851024.1 hypothetical protein [Streptomyces sp. NBC_00893]